MSMFFSHFVLNKKGPLARIWLAAHWDKKLTKAHILEINIENSVEGILQPRAKLPLRTSGHLLLGVVRIYSRKAKYLLAECNEAFVKIKMAFRPGVVDLPEGKQEAALAAITLPEVFHDFETINEMPIEVNPPNTLHQCRAEDITLKEDYGNLNFMGDDGFDMGFDDPEMARDATNIDEGFDQSGLLLLEDLPGPSTSKETPKVQEETDECDNNIVNGELELKGVEQEEQNVNEEMFQSGLFDDAPVSSILPLEMNDDHPDDQANPDFSDNDTYACGPPSIGLPSSPDSSDDLPDETPEITSSTPGLVTSTPMVLRKESSKTFHLPSTSQKDSFDQNESFSLDPLETIVHKGPERTKNRRKRKLIIDEVKNISGEEMKSQLSDTRDIVSPLDLAPPTKKLMHWKESGGVEKLFALPGHALLSKYLSKLYMQHLTTRPLNNEAPNETEEPQIPIIDEEPLAGSSIKRRRVAEKNIQDEPQNLEANWDNTTLELMKPSTQNESQASLDELECFGNGPCPTTEQPIADNDQDLTFSTDGERPTSLDIDYSAETVNLDHDAPKQDSSNNEHQIFIPLEDDDDDYPNPASTGPCEEQMGDETYEQFEERVHEKRATHMLQVIKPNLENRNKIPFSAMTKGNGRKQVAQKFYTLLMLKKQQAIELEQEEAYAEIYISKGPHFYNMDQ